MKTKLFLLAFLSLAGTAFGQSYQKQAFLNMSVPDSNTSRTDTSATFLVGGSSHVDILTTADNADSIAMTTYVDVQLNGDWYNVANLALQKGHPSLHTPAKTYGQNGDLVLRDNGRIADLLQAGTKIRLRNVITGADFAPKTGMTYTQYVILRNQ